jgi:hypothetical protein
MGERAQPWEIAADLERAAKAVLDASLLLDDVHPAALVEIEAIPGTEFINRGTAAAIQALSDKWQAVADAEPDEPEAGSNEWLMRSPQFHPGDLA